jgi:hypothetical protein
MKYCPDCHERYDEEVIQFCTKDGTPLIEESQPNFTTMPSEDADTPEFDFGEETVIRRKPVSGADIPAQSDEPERIVIPTFPTEQQVRPRSQVYYEPPSQQPNTMKTVMLTIIGTLVVLGFGAGLFWLLQKEQPANIFANLNTNLSNQNTNLNTNLGFDSNFNFNTNANLNSGNFNFNMNLNANFRTPSPTPTPRISPSPLTSPSPTPSPVTSPTRASNINRPIPSQTQRVGPRPTVDRPPGE